MSDLGYTETEISEANADIEKMKTLNEYTRHVNPKELKKRGLSDLRIKEALQYVNGTESIEGAPHLKQEHYPVFDTANRCGTGERYIEPLGHVRMMAAVQPFLSGAISKTVNLPAESTVDDIREVYTQAWKMGLKSIALYRDGSKGSQPLSSNNTKDDSKNDKSIKAKTEELGETISALEQKVKNRTIELERLIEESNRLQKSAKSKSKLETPVKKI